MMAARNQSVLWHYINPYYLFIIHISQVRDNPQLYIYYRDSTVIYDMGPLEHSEYLFLSEEESEPVGPQVTASRTLTHKTSDRLLYIADDELTNGDVTANFTGLICLDDMAIPYT